MKFWLLLGACQCAFATAPVWAADARNDEDGAHGDIVVTATRAPLEADEAPVTVSVKDAGEIADELVTDIKDLVRFEPGVSVPRQPARFGAALGTTGRAGNEGFIIRGIGGNRVLIQVDGVRVPDGFAFGAQSVGRGDYVDVGLVKSVEILRGPASALYGSDGLSGAVSFVTSDPADFLDAGDGIGGLVRAAYSSADGEFAETGILAGRSGKVSAMLAYTRRDFEELDNQGGAGGVGSLRTRPNPQDGRSDALLGRLLFHPGGGHKLRLTGEYLDTRLAADVLTGRSATVLDLKARDTGKRARIAADWTWEGEGAFDFARIGLYWQDADDIQFTFEDRAPAADRERLNTFENRVIGAAAEARSEFATGALTHRLVFGADISRTVQSGLRDGIVPPAGETFPTRAFPKTDYVLAGAFIGDEIALAGGRLTLFPAIRFDHYDLSPDDDPLLPQFDATGQSGSRLSPKLGAVLKLGGRFRLFANVATGFKAPEPSQVNQYFENLAFGYTSRPNPDLGPERSTSYEGGIRFTGDAISAGVTGFHADYDDFISQEVVSGSFTPADPAVYQFVNLDRVRVEGVEAKFEGRTAGGVHGSVAISYAKGDVIDPTGVRTPLSSIDPVKLVAGVGYRDPGGRFGAQLFVTHSARKSLERTEGVCSGPCFRPGSFTILDATAFFRVTEGLTLRAGIFNIADEKYAWWNDVRGLAASSAVADAFTQPGRNASAAISYRF
ncbi:TonB-dependent hemoglobin/transferrin/lactoferrin family receptor [Sphingosinicella rhizophila]|uniref:TonB-dependent hemoglobin/transferrin/lactoferrin family receptor n=1 Tax=Sphingosinicella rhizophila TaxID=3050082 RepID=A0ABU3QAA7_9SPHN|nr:TonB-dependent hemoglobin/transferrin/lactoferrin family receptor [Sphingosinicella sp. GR2756]MDT9600341.1 TonB-dependent hemoglobin/transferrin/lactoferrin family receptor [Sphingosinicella sp. GR2756]